VDILGGFFPSKAQSAENFTGGGTERGEKRSSTMWARDLTYASCRIWDHYSFERVFIGKHSQEGSSIKRRGRPTSADRGALKSYSLKRNGQERRGLQLGGENDAGKIFKGE